MADDYVPFDEALKSLKMSEEQLKRLVSQDEIQAIRDPSGAIRLRKKDLDSLATSKVSELTDQLVFADDDDTGMVTAVLEEDSLLEEEDTLDLAPDELEIETPRAPRRRAAKAAAGAAGAATTGVVRSKSRAAAIRGNGDGDEHESTLDRILTIATAVLLLYTLFVAYSISTGQITGLTAWLANMFEVR